MPSRRFMEVVRSRRARASCAPWGATDLAWIVARSTMRSRVGSGVGSPRIPFSRRPPLGAARSDARCVAPLLAASVAARWSRGQWWGGWHGLGRVAVSGASARSGPDRLLQEGSPGEPRASAGGNVGRRNGLPRGSRPRSRATSQGAVNGRGARQHGDVRSAAAEGRALEGVASGGGQETLRARASVDRNRMNPMVGCEMQQARRGVDGESRQGGEKPRSRNVSDPWQGRAEASASSREHAAAWMSTEGRETKNPVEGARLRAGRCEMRLRTPTALVPGGQCRFTDLAESTVHEDPRPPRMAPVFILGKGQRPGTRVLK